MDTMNTTPEDSTTYNPVRNARKYDQSVIRNSNFLSNEQVMALNGWKATKSVENTAGKLNWEKTYAKIRGKDHVFYKREDVVAFIKSKGEDIIELEKASQNSDATIGEKPTESPTKPQGASPESSPERSPESIQNADADDAVQPLSLVNRNSDAFQKFMILHKETQDALKSAQTEAKDAQAAIRVAEKEASKAMVMATMWRTLFGAIGGGAVVVICLISWFAWTNFTKAEQLGLERNSLQDRTVSLQDRAIKLQEQIMHLQTMSSTVQPEPGI